MSWLISRVSSWFFSVRKEGEFELRPLFPWIHGGSKASETMELGSLVIRTQMISVPHAGMRSRWSRCPKPSYQSRGMVVAVLSLLQLESEGVIIVVQSVLGMV